MLTVFAAILFYVSFTVMLAHKRRQQMQAQEIVIQRRRQTQQDY